MASQVAGPSVPRLGPSDQVETGRKKPVSGRYRPPEVREAAGTRLLAKITRADPDDDGLVRTIRVEFRPRNKKDVGKGYRSKLPQFMDIGVQRFAVMLPLEEQGDAGGLPRLGGGDVELPEASEMTVN